MGKIIKNPHAADPYLRAGYPSRQAYLKGIADAFGITYKKVITLADLLGTSEDFDALISTCEDMSWMAE